MLDKITKAEQAWIKFKIGDSHERVSIESHPAHLFVAAYNIGYNAALVDNGHAERPVEVVSESFEDWFNRNQKTVKAGRAMTPRRQRPPAPFPEELKVEDS